MKFRHIKLTKTEQTMLKSLDRIDDTMMPKDAESLHSNEIGWRNLARKLKKEIDEIKYEEWSDAAERNLLS